MAYPDPPGDSKTTTVKTPTPGKSLASEIGSLLGDPPVPKDNKTPVLPATRDTRPPALLTPVTTDAKPATPSTNKKPGLLLGPSTPSTRPADVTLPRLSADTLTGRTAPITPLFPRDTAHPLYTPKTADTAKPPVLGPYKFTTPGAAADRTPPPATPAAPDTRFLPLPKTDYDAQQKRGIDVKNDNPGATAPKYPGPPHDQDKDILRKMLKPSPMAGALYELYLATYTDRSDENRVPESVRIAELHKGVKDRVKSVELFGDSEMFQADRHGIVLHPTGRKSPGHFYAVLRDENAIPVNIIEYHLVNGKPKYLQQWIFDREADPATGGKKTTISQFRESTQTAVGRPAGENATMADAFMGSTEYIAGSNGGITKATTYNNLKKPVVEIDYTGARPTMQLRDPNSGQMRAQQFSRAYMTRMAFSGVYLK